MKFGRRFSSFFCWGKSSELSSTKTPLQISPSNFTTRFWVVAGPMKNLGEICAPKTCAKMGARICAPKIYAKMGAKICVPTTCANNKFEHSVCLEDGSQKQTVPRKSAPILRKTPVPTFPRSSGVRQDCRINGFKMGILALFLVVFSPEDAIHEKS